MCHRACVWPDPIEDAGISAENGSVRRCFALLVFISSAACAPATPPTVDLGQPYVVAVAPARIPMAGGTSIVVAGTGFESGVTVSVGGGSCAGVQLQSSTTITCVPPAHAAGAVDVEVANPNQRTSTLSQQLSFYDPSARPSVATATLSAGGIVTATGYRLEFSVGAPLPPHPAPQGGNIQDLAGLLGILYGP